MPPKLKVKGKKGKRKKGKGKKKGKKAKPEIAPPPLHLLTELYNQLREKVYDLKRTQNKARKKRLEGWYMTREMLNLKHDNEVYHDHLKEKMQEVQKLIEQIMAQLERERAEVDRLIKERMADYDRKIGEYKLRMSKGEIELNDLKIKLLEFEPLIKKLAALLARLKELEAQIPGAELEANIKTRHLKNQYLNERAKLHNHLEAELYKLITTCRSHMMPILSEHLHMMEYENRCNRWDLSRLDVANLKFSQQKELLLEKRNNLNMARGYLNLEWAFNKLYQCEARKLEEMERSRQLKESPPIEDECELSVAFKAYLNDKLGIERRRKEREQRLIILKEEKQRKLELQQEKARKEAEKAALLARKLMDQNKEDEDEWEEEEGDAEISEDEWEEMEYYEDTEGHLVIASSNRMKEHKALIENKKGKQVGDDDDLPDDDDYDDEEDTNELSEKESRASVASSQSSSSDGSIRSDDGVNVNSNEEDYGQGDDDDDDDDKHAGKGKNVPNKSSTSGQSSKSSVLTRASRASAT